MINTHKLINKLEGQSLELQKKLAFFQLCPFQLHPFKLPNVYSSEFSPENVLTYTERFYIKHLLIGQQGYMCVAGEPYGINEGVIVHFCPFTGVVPIIASRYVISDLIRIENERIENEIEREETEENNK